MKKYIILLLLLFYLVLASCTSGISNAETQPLTPADKNSAPPSVTSIVLDKTAQKEIVQRVSKDESAWLDWELFHQDIEQWFSSCETILPKRHMADPILNNGIYYFDSTGKDVTPEQAAKYLLKIMLDSMEKDASDIRDFNVLKYHLYDQKLYRREDMVDYAIEQCDSGEAPTTADDFEDWCSFYFSSCPGISDDMWIFTPAFSFKWSGMAGVSSYEENVKAGTVDQFDMVDIKDILSRSPEANYFILMQDGTFYRMENIEAITGGLSN